MRRVCSAAVLTLVAWGILGAAAAPPATAPAKRTRIEPGQTWPDDRGQHIQAHGGGIIKLGDTWYWVGEYRGQDLPRNERAAGLYASTDLMNWTFKKRIVMPDPENLGGGWVFERPKIYFNAKTGKYVMYFHLDDRGYKYARVGVAVADAIDGEYKFVHSFRPLGQESRDIGQFIDDDGSAYLIFEDRPISGFHIAKLSDDFLTVEKDVAVIKERLEGGAVVKYEGLYYAIGSALTGWRPNPNKYATAKSLAGPWSAFEDIAPPNTNTYGSQSTLMMKVVGTNKTTVVFLGDMWRPQTHWDSRYLWMPLEIGEGRLRLPEPKAWTIDVKTGEASFVK